MSADLETRAQDATERFLEDESLTADLTDAQAKPLITWLTHEAQRIALDPALSNDEVSAALKRLRSAVILSCKDLSVDLLADAILARVQHNLLPNPEPVPSPEREPQVAPPTVPQDDGSQASSEAQPEHPQLSADFALHSAGPQLPREEDNE